VPPSYFVHPSALVESVAIGEGSRVWAFAHVMAGAVLGRSCNVGDHSFIEEGVTIGDDCVIKNGVSIWTGVKLGNRVFVGPNAAFTNDFLPRATVRREFLDTIVEDGASIGANATIVCGITIGRSAMIGAGSVVTRDVPAYSLTYGNPAKHHGWVCACGERLDITDGRTIRCDCGRGYVLRDNVLEAE
jgi:acetyltransferase-like isoleucine patch superfamily enzyme